MEMNYYKQETSHDDERKEVKCSSPTPTETICKFPCPVEMHMKAAYIS
jgi:hypothetical protein